MVPESSRAAVRFVLSAVVTLTSVMILSPVARAASSGVVISQVYGGGGNAGATLKNDFIELFNRGTTAVSLSGWTVQYASSAGTTWSSTALSGSIPAGGYYLVQEAAGTGGTVDLPTPDATGSIAMSATSAKVALVNGSTALSGACPTDASIVDMIGYGAASCSEGNPVASLNNTSAAVRNSEGCAETDANDVDFTRTSPNPRNSASPAHACQYALAVAVDPPGSGSVAASPDQALYEHGSSVQLTATPATGYHFDGWSGDASGSANPVSVTMDGPRSVTAHFAQNPAPGSVVISQAYGGGGNTGAEFTNDFVELYNRGNTPVDLTNWSVQYASADGGTWTMTTLVGTIAPASYFLIQEAAGVGGTRALPTPDMIHDIAIHASDGKLALVNNSIPLTGTCPTSSAIVDLLGYGSASCAETVPLASLNNVAAAIRVVSGCTDVGDNSADFARGTPDPRNSASPRFICDFWVGVGEERLSGAVLGPVVPNPVRGASRIGFTLPGSAEISLDVLDVQGRVVAPLARGTYGPGAHEVIWNAAAGVNARSGVYFIRLRGPGRDIVRQVALTR